MPATRYKLRQLRLQYDAEALARIGGEMAANGQIGLKVEKERFSGSSLEFLNDFTHLEAIAIYGISRGISVLGKMLNLRSVALCGLSTKDLGFLNKLEHLEELWIQGLRLKGWDSLGQLRQVKVITLFNLRQDDFGFLGVMESLQIIHFDRCSGLVSIPSLHKLSVLRRLILDTVNRLEDLSGAASAPVLEDVVVMGADAIEPKAFDCLIGHSTLCGILPGIDLMDSMRYRDLVSRLPEDLLMDGFYGTPNEEFTVR